MEESKLNSQESIMDTRTGEIVEGKTFGDMLKKMGVKAGKTPEEFVKEISGTDLTEKQKQEMKVSHHDTRTKLGIELRKRVKAIGRSNPCPCGSGKKFKKCCLEA